MSTSTVYALLVGIDKYRNPVPPLAGCVNDMLSVKKFLENRVPQDRLNMKVIMDEEATRTNVISAFEEHLGQAQQNDVVFFYYSGHGSQEPAHKAFWKTEPDKMLETLVCVDSRDPEGIDLADKELASLIEMVAENDPHIVVVMDCCNSGSGTRSTNVRNTSFSTKTRALDSYILPKSVRAALTPEQEEDIIIPEGRHVQLSAAQSFQLAKETRLGGTRRGVFTYSFLEVLQNATGPLSYSDIIRKVQTLVNKRTYDQDPQLYTSNESDIDMPFLGEGNIQDKKEYFNLSFDQKTGQWSIDGGAVHGIMGPGGFGDRNTTMLRVYDENVGFADMENTRSFGEVEVTEVEAAKSIVKPYRNLRLDPSKSFRCQISDMPVNPLNFVIEGDHAEGVQMARKAFENTSMKFFLEEVRDAGEADYKIQARTNMGKNPSNPIEGFMITRTSDDDDQPLAEQLIGITEENAEKAVENLNHIARWERILDIHNPGSSINADGVRIELMHPTIDDRLPHTGGRIALSYTPMDDPANLPEFRLKLVNTSHKRLYCSLLYLSSQFAIYTQLIGNGGLWLEPGQEAWALNGRSFKAKIAPALVKMGKREVKEVFKLIVSTMEYKAAGLAQKELSLPKDLTRAGTTRGKYNTRSLMFAEESSSNEKKEDWNATDLTLSVSLLD